MSTTKLSWEQIQKMYDKEWVQLVDYDWPDGEPFPKSGIVRTHHPERKQFYHKVSQITPKPTDSAFIFVGIPLKDPGVIHTNFHKVLT